MDNRSWGDGIDVPGIYRDIGINGYHGTTMPDISMNTSLWRDVKETLHSVTLAAKALYRMSTIILIVR